MKHIKNFLAILALMSIFAGSFVAGRLSAPRSENSLTDGANAAAVREAAILPLLEASRKAAQNETASAEADDVRSSDIDDEVEETEEEGSHGKQQ